MGHPFQVQATSNGFVQHPRKVLHTTPTNQHGRMFLQPMRPLAWNVGHHRLPRGQTNRGHRTLCGVRLLRSLQIHFQTHPTSLRTSLQGRSTSPSPRGLPRTRMSNQLMKRRHRTSKTANNPAMIETETPSKVTPPRSSQRINANVCAHERGWLSPDDARHVSSAWKGWFSPWRSRTTRSTLPSTLSLVDRPTHEGPPRPRLSPSLEPCPYGHGFERTPTAIGWLWTPVEDHGWEPALDRPHPLV